MQAMMADELQVAAQLAGWKPGQTPSDPKAAVAGLLDWVGRTTGAASGSPEEVERAAVHWLAEVARVAPAPGESVADLEERVWERLSEDATRQLMPVWRVGSCMSALGPPDALATEREFLDRVAARLVPSARARQAMDQEWRAICSRPARHHSEVLERLDPDLKALAERPELVRPTLVLALVVALADSNFEFEESRLYDRIAAALGVEAASAATLKDKVCRAFWDAREKLAPKGAEAAAPLSQQVALRAAHECLERAGGLEDLQEEVRSGFMEGLHHGLFEDRDFQKGMKAWRKTPLHWPVGMAVGLTLYIRGRLRAETDRKLLQFLYLVHLREARKAA